MHLLVDSRAGQRGGPGRWKVWRPRWCERGSTLAGVAVGAGQPGLMVRCRAGGRSPVVMVGMSGGAGWSNAQVQQASSMTARRTGPAPGREGRTGHTRMTHRGPDRRDHRWIGWLGTHELRGLKRRWRRLRPAGREGDRLGQVGVAGGLSQQAGEPSVAQLAAERRQVAKVEVSMRDGEAEPETHPPAGQMTGRGQPRLAMTGYPMRRRDGGRPSLRNSRARWPRRRRYDRNPAREEERRAHQ